MKKALVVTTQYVKNYGAVLQAYGFHLFLKNHGWDHEFLNQTSDDSRCFEPIFPIDKTLPYRMLQNARKLPVVGALRRRIRRFDEFVETEISQTRKFKTQKEVMAAQLNYDLYITGGDQLLNRSCLNRPVNLLRFGDETAPRISYSTSMGSAEFSEAEKEKLFLWLNNYTELSMREESAVSFLEDHVACPVHTNIDGSFLIDSADWKRVAAFEKGKLPEKFVLVYELLQHPDLPAAIQKAKETYGLPVVLLTTNTKTACAADYIVRDAGPREFLGLFSNAEMVLTTSFHGTCFSVINKKPFLTLVRSNEQRINALLDNFGLCNNYAVSFKGLPNAVPDFSVAEKTIADARKDAELYLGRFFQ